MYFYYQKTCSELYENRSRFFPKLKSSQLGTLNRTLNFFSKPNAVERDEISGRYGLWSLSVHRRHFSPLIIICRYAVKIRVNNECCDHSMYIIFADPRGKKTPQKLKHSLEYLKEYFSAFINCWMGWTLDAICFVRCLNVTRYSCLLSQQMYCSPGRCCQYGSHCECLRFVKGYFIKNKHFICMKIHCICEKCTSKRMAQNMCSAQNKPYAKTSFSNYKYYH